MAANGPICKNAKRILVMRYRFIGDTILTVPFLRNLRKAYPEAQIDVLVGPESGSVLEHCPYINNLITFDTTRFHKYDSGKGKARNFLSYVTELRENAYDIVFVLKRSWSSGFLSWATGARYRVGWNTEGRRLFLTHPVKWDANQHEVESTLDLLRAAHVPIVDTHLESWVSQSEKEQIENMVPELADSSTKVLIHAAAAHPAKMYPLEQWAQVLRKLKEKANVIFYFTGAAQDIPLYEQLSELAGVKTINLAGKLSLRQSMALYKRMNAAICVDSGPAHLAAAAGTPTIALFGPTNPNRWRPWGEMHKAIFDNALKCCPCQINNYCSERPCLTKLSPELIAETCLGLLAQTTVPKS